MVSRFSTRRGDAKQERSEAVRHASTYPIALRHSYLYRDSERCHGSVELPFWTYRVLLGRQVRRSERSAAFALVQRKDAGKRKRNTSLKSNRLPSWLHGDRITYQPSVYSQICSRECRPYGFQYCTAQAYNIVKSVKRQKTLRPSSPFTLELLQSGFTFRKR
jgi:hypothetical protein